MSDYPGFKINQGMRPRGTKGKKVDVLYRRKEAGRHVSGSKLPASGKGECRWSLSAPAREEESRKAQPFDIVAWKLAE
jgi:hypothetical protein